MCQPAFVLPKPRRYDLASSAEWLDMKLRTLRDRIARGRIKVIKDGKRLLITEEELLRYDREREIFVK